MARGRDSDRPDTGRTAYHEADEVWDNSRRVVLGEGRTRRDLGACRILIVYPDYRDYAEQAAYHSAAEEVLRPRREGEPPMTTLRRIAEIASRRMLSHPLKDMPAVEMSRRQRAAALQRLREQAARAPAGERPDDWE